MATVKIKLNVCKSSKAGKFPLVLQVIHRRQRRLLPIGIKIQPELFNAVKECVRYIPNTEYKRQEIREINRIIDDAKNLVLTKIEQFSGTDYGVEDIVRWYKQRNNRKYLFTYFEMMIEEKKKSGKIGTANAYRSTLQSLKMFCGSYAVTFSDMNGLFLKKYELYLQSQGVSSNTIAYYMRNLKTAYHRAEEEGVFYMSLSGSPFRGLKLKPTQTIKRALPREQIKTIATLDLQNNKSLEFARDMFMASFYLRGIPFVDLVHLMRKNILDNSVYYYRRKTGALIEVTIIQPLQDLIDKYSSDSPYLFPLLSVTHSSPEIMYREYRNALRNYNRNLRQIGLMVGLDAPLTGYVARHSWATNAKNKGASTAIISEGLGHSSENITRVYLKSFDNRVIDQINILVSKL